MARVGEGDERWIVQERADGTNVNNWHWTEKDISAWTRTRLTELLEELVLFSNDTGSAATTSIDSVTGDSVINIRKGKMIATYELAVSVSFVGRAEGNDQIAGTILLPYISEENHDEEPELRVLTTAEGTPATAIRKGILGGRKVITEKVATFVKELREGGPHAGNAKKGPTASAAAESAGAPALPPPHQSAVDSKTASPSSAPSKPPSKATSSTRDDASTTLSLKMEEKFYARSADIYEALTDERRIRAFTQSEATSEPVPGGSFSMFGGTVQGSFVEASPPKRIVQNWRFTNWADDTTSKVTIDITEADTGTVILQLAQTGIPREDRHGNADVLRTVEAGWRRQVFQRIRAVFGYGY